MEAYIEVPFKSASGKIVRPDGLLRVHYGSQKPWAALVEIKTGGNLLAAEQINEYWNIARTQGFDSVITISNEIAPAPGVHPTGGLKLRSNSRVSVHHLSWTLILAEAMKQKVHRGVDDPEQAWLLGELIRYLEHPSSGAMEFDDMGPNWALVRDAAHQSRLSRRDPAVVEIAQRWDQLMRYASIRLGSETGSDVQEVVAKREQGDPSARVRHLVDVLCSNGVFDGALRVPDAAGDINVSVDLRARRIRVWTEIAAPDDRGARARVTWLVRQLADAPAGARLESLAKNARVPETADLAAVVNDPTLLLTGDKRDPVRFRIAVQSPMGTNRRIGKSPGFVESVLSAITAYYERVLQPIAPYQRRAPQRKLADVELPEPLSVEPVEPSEAFPADHRDERSWAESHSWVSDRPLSP